jgi:hypothetical protein
VREADNLLPYSADVKNLGALTLLDPSGPAWPVMGVIFTSMHFHISFNIVTIIYRP